MRIECTRCSRRLMERETCDCPSHVRHEPPPAPGRANVVPEVIADLEQRMRDGTAKYGVPLQTHNGRDALVDLYQELLDACCYIKQRLMEEAAGMLYIPRGVPDAEPVRIVNALPLSAVIAAWERLHAMDTGEVGYCDLERAIEAAGVRLVNDTEPPE